MTTAALVAALVAVGLAACSGASGTAGSPQPVGRLVHSWAQGQGAELADLQRLAPPGSVVLVAAPTERDRLRTTASVDQSALAGIDLSANVLIIVGFPNCQASSHLEFDRVQQTLTAVITRDEKVNCVWAPYTVDAFDVARSDLGGFDPEDLTLTRSGAT